MNPHHLAQFFYVAAFAKVLNTAYLQQRLSIVRLARCLYTAKFRTDCPEPCIVVPCFTVLAAIQGVYLALRESIIHDTLQFIHCSRNSCWFGISFCTVADCWSEAVLTQRFVLSAWTYVLRHMYIPETAVHVCSSLFFDWDHMWGNTYAAFEKTSVCRCAVSCGEAFLDEPKGYYITYEFVRCSEHRKTRRCTSRTDYWSSS